MTAPRSTTRPGEPVEAQTHAVQHGDGRAIKIKLPRTDDDKARAQLLLVNGTFRSLPTGHRPLRCPGRLRQGSFQVRQDEHEHRNAEEQSQRGQ
jgi:hypothetical protein